MMKNVFQKRTLYVLATLLVAILGIHYLDVHCILWRITGIRCPGCGMTRALFSLLQGDLEAYLAYNAMALPMAIAVILELFGAARGRYAKAVHIVFAVVFIMNLVYYLQRI